MQKQKNNPKQKRKRNIIWYNPPFGNSVKTNIGRKIINLVKKYFNKNNPLTKMFNRHNNMRISYSCTANLEKIIKAHNQKVSNKNTKTESKCNCGGSCKYQLKGDNCLTENIVYKDTVNSDLKTKFSSPCALLSLDSDVRIIKKSFKSGLYKKDTELSR